MKYKYTALSIGTLCTIYVLHYVVSALGVNLLTVLFGLSGVLMIMAYFYEPKPQDEKTNFAFVSTDSQNQNKPKSVIIWDRTTIDTPSPSYLQRHSFDALYFCTTTGVNPDLSVVRGAIKGAKINHWEYRTDSTVNLQVCLLLALYHIKKNHGEHVVLHIFTTDADLQRRFKIHANGYGYEELVFKNEEID